MHLVPASEDILYKKVDVGAVESGPPDGHNECLHLCHEDLLFPGSEAVVLLRTDTCLWYGTLLFIVN